MAFLTQVAVCLLAIFLSGCGSGWAQAQRLPVTLKADPASHALIWSDPGGRLDGEVPWVLRRDLLGPKTWIVVDGQNGKARCARALRFRVLAQKRIEYRVEITSDLAGILTWSIRYDKGRNVRLHFCIPGHSRDPGACLRGGIPLPLMEPLKGPIEARLAGGNSFVPVTEVRFVNAPRCRPATKQ